VLSDNAMSVFEVVGELDGDAVVVGSELQAQRHRLLVVGDVDGDVVGSEVAGEIDGDRVGSDAVGDVVGHKVPLPTAWVAASSYPANESVQSKHAVATSAAWSIGSVKETRTKTEPGETEMKSGVVVSPVISAIFWRKSASNSEVLPFGKSMLKFMS